MLCGISCWGLSLSSSTGSPLSWHSEQPYTLVREILTLTALAGTGLAPSQPKSSPSLSQWCPRGVLEDHLARTQLLSSSPYPASGAAAAIPTQVALLEGQACKLLGSPRPGREHLPGDNPPQGILLAHGHRWSTLRL